MRQGFSWKGQSAIEYLMTYGWMLLVVAIIGGLLFTLFQDQDIDGNQVDGFMDEQVTVERFSPTSDGLQMQLRNGEAEEITIQKIEVIGEDNETTSNLANNIDLAETQSLTLENISQSPDTQESEVKITYETDNGLTNTAEGTITGNLKVNESGSTETATLSVRNLDQNDSKISSADNVKLFSQGKASEGLSHAILATNETGSWENKSIYNSPKSLSGTDTWKWSNFTWRNSTTSMKTVNWKIYYNDTKGNYKSTGTENFSITGLTVDGFEDGDISYYAGDTSHIETSSNKVYNGSKSLKLLGQTDGKTVQVGANSGLGHKLDQGEVFEVYTYPVNDGDGYRIGWGAQDDSAGKQYGAELEVSSNTYRVGIWGNSVINNWKSTDSSVNLENGYWYRHVVDWNTDGSMTVELYNASSGNKLTTLSFSDSSYTDGGIAFQAIFDDMYVDSYRIIQN